MHTLKFPFSLSCLLLITNEIISAYALQIWLKYQTLFIKYVTLKKYDKMFQKSLSFAIFIHFIVCEIKSTFCNERVYLCNQSNVGTKQNRNIIIFVCKKKKAVV